MKTIVVKDWIVQASFFKSSGATFRRPEFTSLIEVIPDKGLSFYTVPDAFLKHLKALSADGEVYCATDSLINGIVAGTDPIRGVSLSPNSPAIYYFPYNSAFPEALSKVFGFDDDDDDTIRVELRIESFTYEI